MILGCSDIYMSFILVWCKRLGALPSSENYRTPPYPLLQELGSDTYSACTTVLDPREVIRAAHVVVRVTHRIDVCEHNDGQAYARTRRRGDSLATVPAQSTRLAGRCRKPRSKSLS